MRIRKSIPLALLPLLLATLLTGGVAAETPIADAAPAADEDYADDYEEHARVMRISLLRGEVSVRRAGNLEWESAKLNLPLVEGDTLATGPEARLEIQIDARNFVRVGPDSVLRVVTLREDGIALSLSEGTATLRLARFDAEREYFEVDAPKTTVAAEKQGLYRLSVARDGGVAVTVRDDGRARIYSETSGFTLRDRKSARLIYDGQAEGDWEIGGIASFDAWDAWVDERERYLASRLRHEDRERYYDRDVWGAEELDAYGDWTYTKDYGYVWRPHVTVINNYYNWAPYRYGHWRWCPPYGWTWVADEDWGWAPYHYGRWVYYNNNWCWAPRGYGYHYGRAWWRPALVAFVYIPSSRGEHVSWYPLQHGQRDPRGRHGHRRGRLTPLRAGELANLERRNPALLRAVTTLPAREFGVASTRARPASIEIARRAVTTDPVRGRLPITPDVSRSNAPDMTAGRDGDTAGRRLGATGRGRTTQGSEGPLVAGASPVRPPRALPDRPTGAAERTPGAPLGAELRRSRVFNNREPRLPSPSLEDGNDRAVERHTGAVTRPPRPERRVPVERPRNAESDGGGVPTDLRPDRPARRSPPERERDDNDGTVERSRPVRPSEERPVVTPRVYERERDDTPARRPESERREAPAPRREQAPPAERPERSAPPPAREERAPAPREEPAPQPRQERNEPSPPARSEPRGERPAPARPPAASGPRLKEQPR